VRVRHEQHRREVEVRRVERVGANFVRITFAGDEIAGFVSDSFDDHLKFMFPGSTGEIVRRDYTPRSFDRARRELDIEFALHGPGEASAWAGRARPGDRATIGGPRGSMIVPKDYPWHLLAGDASALPAIHRRLDELPASAQAIVIVQVDDAADRRRFDSAARPDVRWLARSDDLAAALRALPWPDGEGFAWCAGEATAMARVRDVLLHEKQHPREAMRVAAYWKQGAHDFHEALEA
jgi:NADPH-dependent ferric siderophore reductase